MKKVIIVFLVTMVLPLSQLFAQYAYFPDQGTITYEKTVHVKNLLRRHLNSLKEGDFSKRFIEDMIDKAEETAILRKKLTFKDSEIVYEPVVEKHNAAVENLLRMGLLDYQPSIYQDLVGNQTRSTFEVGGSKLFIQDSLMDVKWKITDEYREIAGYECRRANGVVLDSVYVVAFYTDQIPASGGPGTIHGLPGMILGFVVPEQHFNIYAKTVETNTPTLKPVEAGRRETPMTREQFLNQMRTTFGNWMTPQQVNLILASMQL